MNENRKIRFEGLDVLRELAALCVVMSHAPPGAFFIHTELDAAVERQDLAGANYYLCFCPIVILRRVTAMFGMHNPGLKPIACAAALAQKNTVLRNLPLPMALRARRYAFPRSCRSTFM